MTITGARQGRPSGVRALIARAMARDLRAMVIPGPEVAWAAGLDVEAAGVRISATPRDANVLLLVGDLPPRLCAAAAVAYAQMVRPRAILALEFKTTPPLPNADITAGLSQEELNTAVAQLRKALAKGAFSPSVADFDAPVLHGSIQYVCPMHPDVIEDAPGSCPQCGMNLVARDAGGRSSAEDAREGGHHRGAMEHEHHHGGGAHEQHHSAAEDPPHEDQGHHGHDVHGHTDHGDSDHDHGGVGFMSMVEVTRDLARSRDGLPMDWLEVPFGPFFPGLPGGLLLTLTLDGDGVARGRARSLAGGALPALGPGIKAPTFVDQFALVSPLAPMAYRVLACRAIKGAVGLTEDEVGQRAGIFAVERERVANHLGWLAQLGRQIGFEWLGRRATALQLGVLRADHGQLPTLRPAVGKLRRRLERTPLLRSRLTGIGQLTTRSELRGPVARAAGCGDDVRLEDAVYRDLGFDTCTEQGGDAWARLQVRMAEIATSLDLIRAVGSAGLPALPEIGRASGDGEAVLETPRGRATLRLTLEGGNVIAAGLDTPCSQHIGLVPELVREQELGDALVAVGSLDLSPWEVLA